MTPSRFPLILSAKDPCPRFAGRPGLIGLPRSRSSPGRVSRARDLVYVRRATAASCQAATLSRGRAPQAAHRRRARRTRHAARRGRARPCGADRRAIAADAGRLVPARGGVHAARPGRARRRHCAAARRDALHARTGALQRRDRRDGEADRHAEGLGTTATVVGVNGDFFAANPGKPTGMLMRGGVARLRAVPRAVESRDRGRRDAHGRAASPSTGPGAAAASAASST